MTKERRDLMKGIQINIRRKLVLLLIGMFCLTALAACDDFEKSAYKTLFIAGTAYDTGMKTIADLQRQGKITEAQRAEINKYALAFYAAYQQAIPLLKSYNKTKSLSDKEQLIAMLNTFSVVWGNFMAEANKVVPNAIGTMEATAAQAPPATTAVPAEVKK